MKIYVASSWRNDAQPAVVRALRKEGYDVHDFRNPGPADTGFHWSQIDPEWKAWGREEAAAALDHHVAVKSYRTDMSALGEADVVVLLLPAGRSACLEFGWAIGQGKPGAIVLADGDPELMYRMATVVVCTVGGLLVWLSNTAMSLRHSRALAGEPL